MKSGQLLVGFWGLWVVGTVLLAGLFWIMNSQPLTPAGHLWQSLSATVSLWFLGRSSWSLFKFTSWWLLERKRNDG